jgi:ribose/xylose/arabinose/galactoside ABC-type transport system permease subunit
MSRPHSPAAADRPVATRETAGGEPHNAGPSRWKTIAGRLHLAGQSRLYGLALATILLLIILAIKDPHYITLGNFQVIALENVTVGIASVGTVFLMISGNVDLSIGSMAGLVATASALLSLSLPEPLPIVLGVLIGLVCGIFNGALVWRISISPIIITIGSLSLFYGIALVLNQGEDVPNVPGNFTSFGSVTVFGFNIGVVFFLALCILAGLFLAKTVPGKYLYAIGGNREAAARVGIPIRRFVLGTFAFSGLLVGLAGVLLASQFGTASPDFGVNLEVQVITAVILGGVAFSGGEGGIGGMLLAVIFLGVLNSMVIALGINQYFADIIQGAALIGAVGLDQLAREQRERRKRALALADMKESGSQP